ncbi:AlpA family phage regulatory protein [Ideonella sp. B7]|uniref:helix-turn-helix transcriptional regulator n=1 Tax=Ideonella benzenivorans TaxID=2831643 RepID=UPI001CECC29C|nr:AlpA family phage regulatory protein [Ideonella benzenivorans]MCA6214989.1 AlpA family phage regulatory protein [Ideonella benzenivorans]
MSSLVALASVKQAPEAANRDRLIRRPEVLRILGVSKTTWYGMVARGEAPRGFRISARCVGWSERAIYDFVKQRQQGAGPREV